MSFFKIVVALSIILIGLIIKRKIQSPEKSFLACTLNVVLTPMRLLKLGPFKGGEKMVRDLQSTIIYATKKSKLEDFGGTEFIKNYNSVINTATHRKEKFTNLGFISAKIELGMGWVRRLKLIEYLKKAPQVKQIPVRSPVFVMGLPRTGTTYLHRLLSLDPLVRSPLTWELLAPVPTPGENASPAEHESDRQKRISYVKKLIKTRETIGDGSLKHIHEIGYDLPEECLLGLSDQLPFHLSLMHACYMNLDLVLAQDATAAYAHYKSILQLLSFQIGERASPRRWVLKCPVHLFYPKEIAAVFPDAKLIWTHRHPASAVPSLCSLVEAFHKVYYEPNQMDPEFGAKIRDSTANVLLKAPKDMGQSGLDCVNVTYASLVADPIGTVKFIYDHYGWEFSKEYESNLLAYISDDTKKRERMKASSEKLHTYTAAQYGISDSDLTSGKFEEYVNAYNIPFDNK